MKHDEIKANAEVMLAFVNGKTIQNRRKSRGAGAGWNDVPPNSTFPPDFTFAEFEYRIKPMPEEFFITVYGDNARRSVQNGAWGDDDNVGAVYSSAADARKGGVGGHRVFRVVEVTE